MSPLVQLSRLWQNGRVLMRHPSHSLIVSVLLAGGVCAAPLQGLDLASFSPSPESYFKASVLQDGVLKNTANVESRLVAALDPETMQSPVLTIRIRAQLSPSNSVFVTLGDFLRIECDGRWRIWAGDKMETLYDTPPPSLPWTGIYNLKLTLRADTGRIIFVGGNDLYGNLLSSSFDDIPLHWKGAGSDVSQWAQASVKLRGENATLLAFDVKTAFEPTRVLIR